MSRCRWSGPSPTRLRVGTPAVLESAFDRFEEALQAEGAIGVG